jgi:DNA repair exonuclease SbcCD ATPase subunit
MVLTKVEQTRLIKIKKEKKNNKQLKKEENNIKNKIKKVNNNLNKLEKTLKKEFSKKVLKGGFNSNQPKYTQKASEYIMMISNYKIKLYEIKQLYMNCLISLNEIKDLENDISKMNINSENNIKLRTRKNKEQEKIKNYNDKINKLYNISNANKQTNKKINMRPESIINKKSINELETKINDFVKLPGIKEHHDLIEKNNKEINEVKTQINEVKTQIEEAKKKNGNINKNRNINNMNLNNMNLNY